MDHLRILIRIALRNLFATKLNLIIGGIILVGTLLVVVGGALLDSMDQSMSRSIIGSGAGNIQVYSAKSKDPLALYGAMGAEPDLSAIDDFSKIKMALETIPNVKTVVPMGINAALITSGNTVDIALEKLRALVRQRQQGNRDPDLEAKLKSQRDYVRQILHVLQSDMKKRSVLVSEKAIEPENVEALQRASSNEFWESFERDPLDALEFLENRIAPQSSDADLVYLRYMGTDLDDFQKSFDRLKIVDGQAVPTGHRGFLFAKFFYENQLKLKAAKRLDKIKKTVVDQGKRIVARGRKGELSEAEQLLKDNQAQTQEIILQLDRIKTEIAVQRLQRELGSKETDLDALLKHFFEMNDENFSRRYAFFYEQLAPLLELYRIRVGDVLTIKAFTRSGYVQSVNVPVYGTFQFKGMEDAALAGNLNLMDLVSFRDLYGYLSADKIEEVEKLKKLAGAKEIDRSRAEDELFGTAKTVVAEATPGIIIDDGSETRGSLRALRREELLRRVYSKGEMDNGVLLSAAVILKDPTKLRQTMKEIQAVSARDKLELKVVSWQEAAGLIGQFVSLAKLALYIAVFIIFVVALVIINNAMMMATLQRGHEIGTMRAIGAQRRFVLGLVLTEIIVLGLVFGGVGAALGTGVVKWLGSVGIAAPNDWFYFFFSGPRLHPWLTAGNLIAAFVIVLLVSAISTLYPAFMAARVAPVRAMQAEE